MIKISFSAAQKYLLSPFSYFAHYYLRLRPVQLSSALIFGSALDTGLNSLLMDIKNEVSVNLDKAKEAFNSAFEDNPLIKYSKADLDESLLTEEDLQSDKNKSWLSLKRKGHVLIEEYHSQVIPKLEKVLLVQHEINLKNATGDVFTGIIDFVGQIGGKLYVIDNKSSTKKYTPESANESAQLSTYHESIKNEYKLDGVAYIVLPKTVRKKKLPRIEIQIIFGEANEELTDKTFKEYDEVLTGIKTGKFPCTPEKCCKEFWGCAYEGFCKSGGTDMTGLEFKKERTK